MKVAIMQPYLFPYVGYFQLINAADKFIVYDDVNYINSGWINRNKILLNGRAHLITFPCRQASQNKLINEIELELDTKKENRLFKTFSHAYNKAPMYKTTIELIRDLFNYTDRNLSNFITNSIQLLCNYLGINTQIKKSSDLYSESRNLEKADRLVFITKSEGATEYINPIGGRTLYTKEYFSKDGINLSFLETKFIGYKQFEKDFVPGLSIIDLMMFNDKDTILAMLESYVLV